MSTMKDIAKIVAERNNMARPDAEQFVAAMFDQLKIGLSADEQVKVKGLGTFKVQTMRSRMSVNVNTGERVVIDSHDRISFNPDKTMAEAVNRPFAHFETVVLNDGVVFEDIESNAIPKATENAEPEVPTEEIANQEIAELTEDDVQQETTTKPEPIAEIAEQTSSLMTEDAEEQEVEVELPTKENAEPPTLPVIEQPTVTDEEPAKNTMEKETTVAESNSDSVVVTESVVVNGPIVVNGPVMLKDDNKTATNKNDNVDESSSTAPITPVMQQPMDTPEQYTDYNETPQDYNLSTEDKERSESIWFTLIICLVMLIVGFIIGRSTADITFNDMKNLITFNEKQNVTPEDVTIVYAGEKEHEIQAHNDSLIADSLEKAKEDKRKEEVKKAVEAQISSCEDLEKKKEAKTDEIKQKAAEEAKKAAEAKAAAEAKKVAEAKKAAEAKAAEAKKAAEEKAASGSLISDKYKNDLRIKTGAYTIVGVQQTVTVRKGQTLASISKAYLGPGMECYVEAINGTSSIKEGQKLKIPQLKIKKSKR